MIKKFLLLCFAVVILECPANSKTKYKKPVSEETMQDFHSIVYPYKAPEKRTLQIKENCNKLKKGMTDTEVIKLLEKPDLISPFYNTVKGGKVEGKFYYYLLSQTKKEGSQKEKNTASIAVYFDLNHKLIYAYGEKTPFFRNIEKEPVTASER